MKISLKIVEGKDRNKNLILDIETENEDESEVETETEPETETESLCECECECEPLNKSNRVKKNDNNIKFIKKVPTHPRNHLKRKINQLTFKYY